MDTYYQSMKAHGFSKNTVDSLRKFKCPNCGFVFSITYARTFACRGCPEVMNSCPKVRCAKCDHEFFFKEAPHINGEMRERQISQHVTSVVKSYYDEQGWKKSR